MMTIVIRSLAFFALVLAACDPGPVYPPTPVHELDDVVSLDFAVAEHSVCVRTSERDISCAAWTTGLEWMHVEAPAPIAMMAMWGPKAVCFTDVERRAYCISEDTDWLSPLPDGEPIPAGELALLSEDALEIADLCVRGSAGDVRYVYQEHGFEPLVEAGASDIAMGIHGDGDFALCAVVTGEVFCWGTPGFEPGVKVSGVRDAVQVEPAMNHACARRMDGNIACWGTNEEGQLGTGTRSRFEREARPVVGIDDAIDLALRPDRSCALRSDGTVWCWGRVSLPEFEQSSLPRRVEGLEDVVALDGDCALTRAGKVICWGEPRIVKAPN